MINLGFSSSRRWRHLHWNVQLETTNMTLFTTLSRATERRLKPGNDGICD